MGQGQRSHWSRSYKDLKQRQVGSQQHQVASLLLINLDPIFGWHMSAPQALSNNPGIREGFMEPVDMCQAALISTKSEICNCIVDHINI